MINGWQMEPMSADTQWHYCYKEGRESILSYQKAVLK